MVNENEKLKAEKKKERTKMVIKKDDLHINMIDKITQHNTKQYKINHNITQSNPTQDRTEQHNST